LDEESRRHAGLNSGGQVMIAGALDCLEIWRPSRYRTVRVEDGVTQPARTWIDEDDE
jgi:DNA-binding transcriptional regulator/RsmH inhibitor MraZ